VKKLYQKACENGAGFEMDFDPIKFEEYER
jgi:hypothetical protein